MTIVEFYNAYKAKNFMNTKQGEDEKSKWIRNQLEIKTYIPFKEKRKIAEMIVEQNIEVVDGIKKYDSIDGYVSLVAASIAAHTSLQFGNDPIADYDLLAESGLLSAIMAEFADSHQEIDLLVHMVLDMEMEDNEINALLGKFLNSIQNGLDGLFSGINETIKDLNIEKLLGADFKKEDLAKLISLFNKTK